MNKLLRKLSWYVGALSDWLYFKACPHDYVAPYYCDHCGKWSFEPKYEES